MSSVSVLTPVLDEEEFIEPVVERMREQDFGGEIEFLFMDGRSTDGTRRILERLAAQDPRIRVLDNPARHTAAGLNVGLAAATGDYVARMDAHTYYPAHYLRVGIERLERGDVAWVCGPQVPHGAGGRWSERVALVLGSRLGVGASNRFGSGGAPAEEVELDTGVFTGIWRRETLARHGGWDVGWPINQDSELASRMLSAGERIVSLQALAAQYVPRNSVRKLSRQYFRYGMYRAKTARRHPHSFRRSLLMPPAVVTAGTCSFLPARPVRLPARGGFLVYLAAVAGVSIRLALRHGRLQETPTLMLVFLTMHLCWGVGFLVGSARFARLEP